MTKRTAPDTPPADPAADTTSPAGDAAPEQPTAGGSYVRQPDGSLTRAIEEN